MAKGRNASLVGFIKKLHLVDYLIIIAVLLGVVILYRFFTPHKDWVTITVSDTDMPLFQAAALRKGDTEKDAGGKTTAVIENVYTYDESDPSLFLGGYKNKQNAFLTIKLLANVNKRSGEYEYKNKTFKIGSPIEFLFTSGYLKGLIAEIGTKRKQYETKTVMVKLYDVYPWFAERVSVGSAEYDGSGNKILEVVNTSTTPTGDAKVNMDILLRMKVVPFGTKYVYRADSTLSIGDQLDFTAGKTRIEKATIVEIDEK